MPDFNKGDFTQQGVAGHVNANIRLNEKRLVNIDLTSNEAAEGCTITGTVKDLLNDKVYGIGSGVSGNIEITENGENINVAPYATATVNVSGGGGSDLLHTTVTIVNNRSSAYVPDATLIGYAVQLSELDDTNEPVLYSDSHMVDLSDLSLSVPRNSSLTFNAYYLNSQTTEYSGGIMGVDSTATATNMIYVAEPGGWGITDITLNSSLTYVIES